MILIFFLELNELNIFLIASRSWRFRFL